MFSTKYIIPFASLLTVLAADNSLLFRNGTIHPVSGPNQENMSLLVLDGKIAEMGPKIVPPKGKTVKIIDAKGLHIYPGMIDSGTAVGISEIGSIRETSDYGEVGEFNPQLRPLIAVNPESEHIPVTRANGITSVLLLPALGGGGGRSAGAIIGGQASMIHLDGWTWEEMEINRSVALQIRYPVIASRRFNPEAAPATAPNYQQARQEKENEVRRLKAFFDEARAYKLAKESKLPDWRIDLKFEAMIPVLDRKLPVLILAGRERDIKEAIEFAEEQRVKFILGGVHHPGKQTEVIAKKKIPVILGSTLSAEEDEDDAYDAAYSLPGELYKAGVKFAFGTFGTQFARNLPYEAAMAVTYGLPHEEGLKSVTLNAAEIWGIAEQYGSIDKGKTADLIVTDGDPLEIRTQLKMMFIKGEAVDLESRHTRLYKKWMARP